tara:strand:+ start:14126 stop:15325 length:1200 start_codon:yes stop_codon:yes gene_type:complete
MSFNNFTLELLNRDTSIFENDLEFLENKIKKIIKNSNFLVLGAAGTIGQAVTKEIFKRNPNKLHAVDISENNLVELVRDLRSSIGYIDGEFKTFAIDCGEIEFESMVKEEGPYDYVLNLSALKHVRSEKDPYTLMRLISVNIINTVKTLEIFKKIGVKKYFCVSTDKAANPVNMMGASKRIMEFFLMKESNSLQISMARFANVAFSDGSLLHGFNQRFLKQQPFSAPKDIKRYFISAQESGELCLFSCLFGENRDIFFPKLNEDLDLKKFSDLGKKYLELKGYVPLICSSEEEARKKISDVLLNNEWPCYFFESDTTGEKAYEEFYTSKEVLDLNRFKKIGIIKNKDISNTENLEYFYKKILELKHNKKWTKKDILKLFYSVIQDFEHEEKDKFLDERM